MTGIKNKFPHILSALLYIVTLVSLSACNQSITFEKSDSAGIKGFISGFPGSMSFALGSLNCVDAEVLLYRLNADGSKATPALSRASVQSNGSYELRSNTSIKQISANAKVSYTLEVTGCDQDLSRPVTGITNQTISPVSTFVSRSAELIVDNKNSLADISKSTIEALITSLSSVSGTDYTTIYTNAVADVTASANFQNAFNVTLSDMTNSAPDFDTVTAPATVNEMATGAYSATANHWFAAFPFAYEWFLDGVSVSTSASYNYVPSKNAQGAHTLVVKVGADDGGGNIDATKPVNTHSISITVINTFPPVVPVVSLQSGTPTTDDDIVLRFTNNGTTPECDTFTSLAITENPVVLPTDTFSYTCSALAGNTQDLNYAMSLGDGARILYLWTKDSKGNISSSARTVNVTLDRSLPTVSITNVGPLLRGGQSQNITFTKSDATSGLASVKLQYADDGSTFADIATVTASASPYAWTVPSDNTTTAKLKIIATDNAGNSNSAETSAFTIDSVSPGAPVISRSSSALSNSTTVTISVTCVADYAKVLFSESSTTPAANAAAWENCSATKNFTVSTGDGLKTIYVFSKDAANNISTSSNNVTMTLDQTVPVVSLTNFNSGIYAGGSSASITWTATDTNFGATPISVSYSTNNGTSWTSIAASTANDGAESWTLPSIDNNQVKVRVIGVDAAGNSTTAVSSASLIIDSSVPVISSFQINGGVVNATSPYVAYSFVSADTMSGITHACMRPDDNTTPAANDSCWFVATSTLSGNILLSFVPGSHNMYLWVKNGAGLISTLTSTDGVDMDSATVPQLVAPVIANMIISNTSTPTNPILASEKQFNGSQSAYISWKMLPGGTNTINAGAVRITAIDASGNVTVVASSLDNASNSGCTPDGASTLDDGNTGCFVWTSAPATQFKIVLSVVNSQNLSSEKNSTPLNVPQINIIAGDTSLGLNASAANAIFKPKTDNWGSETGNFVVTSKGLIFFRDMINGLVYVDPATGIVKQVLKITGTESGDGGSVANATACGIGKLALDYQDRVLLLDCTHIRRINTSVSPMTIESVIGGGGSIADGTDAGSFSLNWWTWNCQGVWCSISGRTNFFVMPNGNIYFGLDGNKKLYYYKESDGKVYQVNIGGTGDNVDTGYDFATRDYFDLGIEFNPNTSDIISAFTHTYHTNTGDGWNQAARLNPLTFQSEAPHPPSLNYGDESYHTGMDGKVYAYAARYGRFAKLDTTTNTYTVIAGTGIPDAPKNCFTEGMLATNCNFWFTHTGFFVDRQSRVYMMTNDGLLYYIKPDGTITKLIGSLKNSGDNSLASDARIQNISGLGEYSDGKVVILDSTNRRLRLISPGATIKTIAGNQSGNFNVMGGVDASTRDLSMQENFVIDSSDRLIGSCSPNGGAGVCALNYDSGNNWYEFEMLSYTKDEGNNNMYRGFLGIANNKAYSGSARYDNVLGTWVYRQLDLGVSDFSNSDPATNFSYISDVTSGSPVYNSNINTSSEYCADNTSLVNCQMSWSWNNPLPKGEYYAADNSLYTIKTDSGRFVRLDFTANKLFNVVDVGMGVKNFALRTMPNSDQILYHCSGGQIYYRNITQAGSSNALNWPITSMSCVGTSMIYNSGRNSLIFSFQENGLYGVAEYSLPW